MPTTSNFGWTTPADTDLVKDGAAAIRTLGNGIDTSFLDLKGGTTDQVLAKNSNTDLDFKWVAQDDSNAIQNALLTTTGDTIYASAASTPARLGVGSTGQVLTVAGGVPTWATPAAGGGMTSIATGSLTGSSVAITSISGSYKDLKLVIRNYKPATDNTFLKGRFNNNTGNTYGTGVAPANIVPGSFSDNFFYVTQSNDDSVATGLAIFNVFDYANTATWKVGTGVGLGVNATTTTQFNAMFPYVFWNQTAAIDRIDLFPDSGNFTSGDYILYGVS